MSIFDNIAMKTGENVDASLLYKAVENAQIASFADSLPEKLEYRVGEGGSLLSGGQRQRISIARAIYKDAPVLLFDEANSAIDNQNIKNMNKELDAVTMGKTSLSVTHRLVDMESYDIIFVMDDGRIVEQGSHEHLMDLGGIYAAMRPSGSV
jgi:ABC-type multidrug transport system fused ATPase/permease subunit